MGLLLVGAPRSAVAQSDLQAEQQSTEERLAALKKQIEEDQARLEEAAEQEQATRERLDNIRREIALREELVATYRERARQLEAERATLADTLDGLETRLDDLREDYRVRARHAYMYGRSHDLALILASRSVNQMLVRIRYLRRFAEQRRATRTDIQDAATAVRSRREALEDKRDRTQQLLAEARRERQNLQGLQSDRRRVIQELRTQRTELREEIEEKQSQARELEQRIRQLVAEAEQRAEERAETESAEVRAAREEAYANLSASFQENRGRLPWPAEGAITESFGNRVDPVHGTTTYHPGILIATTPGGEVRAVFRGTVSGIDFVPGYGTYLVIRHGEYLSVYSNFSSLYVSTGDEIDAGEVLGAAGTDNEPRGAAIFFAVFDKNQNTSVDPTRWLANR